MFMHNIYKSYNSIPRNIIKLLILFLIMFGMFVFGIKFSKSVSAVEPKDFIQCRNQLNKIKSEYNDKKSIELIEILLEYLDEVIAGKETLIPAIEKEGNIKIVLYYMIVLPIIRLNGFERFTNPKVFPPNSLKSIEGEPRICFGKTTSGNYWYFIIKEDGVELKKY